MPENGAGIGKGGNPLALSPLRLIAYERVSTARQGQSGLGLEAQRRAIDTYAASRGAEVLARFTEVESGRNPDRPELGTAIRLARLTGATLVIAKLDRLSRNAAFLLTLRDSSVRFLACDMPDPVALGLRMPRVPISPAKTVAEPISRKRAKIQRTWAARSSSMTSLRFSTR